jgi:hypothetical protein
VDLKVTIHFGSEVISEGKKNRSKDVFKVVLEMDSIIHFKFGL